jgi:hypothetical protein
VIWLQSPTAFWVRGGTISWLSNVHGVNDVGQTELHIAKPLLPEPAIEKLKTHKSPSTDQLPAELIKAGGRTIHSESHKLFNSIWNSKNCLRSGKS